MEAKKIIGQLKRMQNELAVIKAKLQESDFMPDDVAGNISEMEYSLNFVALICAIECKIES